MAKMIWVECAVCATEWTETEARINVMAIKPLRCATCGATEVDVVTKVGDDRYTVKK